MRISLLVKLKEPWCMLCIVYCILLCCVWQVDSYGDEAPIVRCGMPTPALWDMSQKPKIYMTNNLRKRVGAFEFARGKPITIRGRILDEKCEPVKWAVVQIWHADAGGNRRFNIPEFTYVNDSSLYSDKNHFTGSDNYEQEDEAVDPFFVGSGSSTTDNAGAYTFHTIMPGSIDRTIRPHIWMNISGRELNEFYTVMLFPEHSNQVTFLGKDLNEESMKLLTCKKIADQEYYFEIVLQSRYNNE